MCMLMWRHLGVRWDEECERWKQLKTFVSLESIFSLWGLQWLLFFRKSTTCSAYQCHKIHCTSISHVLEVTIQTVQMRTKTSFPFFLPQIYCCWDRCYSNKWTQYNLGLSTLTSNGEMVNSLQPQHEKWATFHASYWITLRWSSWIFCLHTSSLNTSVQNSLLLLVGWTPSYRIGCTSQGCVRQRIKHINHIKPIHQTMIHCCDSWRGFKLNYT